MPPDAKAPFHGRLSVNDAAVLLIDHQAGLLSLVQDYSPDEFRNNVLALADIAKHFRLPTILTTSFENGSATPGTVTSKDERTVLTQVQFAF